MSEKGKQNIQLNRQFQQEKKYNEKLLIAFIREHLPCNQLGKESYSIHWETHFILPGDRVELAMKKCEQLQHQLGPL